MLIIGNLLNPWFDITFAIYSDSFNNCIELNLSLAQFAIYIYMYLFFPDLSPALNQLSLKIVRPARELVTLCRSKDESNQKLNAVYKRLYCLGNKCLLSAIQFTAHKHTHARTHTFAHTCICEVGVSVTRNCCKSATTTIMATATVPPNELVRKLHYLSLPVVPCPADPLAPLSPLTLIRLAEHCSQLPGTLKRRWPSPL